MNRPHTADAVGALAVAEEGGGYAGRGYAGRGYADRGYAMVAVVKRSRGSS